MWQIMAKQVPACKNADLKNNSFTCLRNATVAQIQAAAEFADDYSSADFPWVPVIDGGNNLIPELASNMLANSRFASVPFIAGANLDEGKTPTTKPLFGSKS
jgi:acetylcholinesterase